VCHSFGRLHQRSKNHLLRIYELAREASTSRTCSLPPSTEWSQLALGEPRFGYQATRGDHGGSHACVQTGSSILFKQLDLGSGLFLISVPRQAGAGVPGGWRRLVFGRPIRGALGIARDLRARFRAPAAGAPPPGSPPRWAPVGPSAVVSAAHEPGRAGGVPAVGGRGGVLVPQVARSAVPALRGWSGEPQKPVETRWNGIGVVRGWSPPRTGQVCERISAQTPWIHTPNPKSGSGIAIDTRSVVPMSRRGM
jgi:hypothetical protein